ncbi:MAG TPA: AI-2E family transporter [Thermoleophilaceae bacterium]
MEAAGARAGPDTRTILRVVAIVVAAAIGVYVVYLLRRPLGWLFIAAFIALAVSRPVAVLSQRMRRGVAILIVYLTMLLIPAALLALLVPPIVTQVNHLVDRAPQYADDVTEFVDDNRTLRDLNEKYDVTTKLEEEAGKLPSKVGDAAGVLADIGIGLVNSIFAGVTIFILSVFMVGGGPRWRKAFLGMHPPPRAEAFDRLFDRVTDAVGNYVLGALLQATIAGTTAWIVLVLLGVPSPAALAVVVFVLDLVPLVGATLAAVVVGIVTLFADFPLDPVVWTAWSVIYQQLENNVIQPRIQSRAVQIEPFVVLVSVLFGSALFGLAGALVAIPVTASLQIAVREWLLFRHGTDTATLAEPRAAEPDEPPVDRPPDGPAGVGDGPAPEPA